MVGYGTGRHRIAVADIARGFGAVGLLIVAVHHQKMVLSGTAGGGAPGGVGEEGADLDTRQRAERKHSRVNVDAVDIIALRGNRRKREGDELKNILKYLCVLPLLVACEGGILGGDKEAERKSTSIVETGELSAVRTKAFVMPRFGRWSSMRIIGLEEHGKVIQPGDSVIQLDPADVTKYIVDRETALESQLASLETMLVNQENRGSENESTIKSELATYELRKLTLGVSAGNDSA